MDTIVIEPAKLYALILAFCTAVVSLSAAIGVAVKIVNHLRKPTMDHRNQLHSHEEWLQNHDSKLHDLWEQLDKSNERLDELEEGNRVVQRSLLALMSHAINGNDIEALREARDEMENYLIGR